MQSFSFFPSIQSDDYLNRAVVSITFWQGLATVFVFL